MTATTVFSLQSHGYTREQGHAAAAAWLQQCAVRSRPVTAWTAALDNAARGQAAFPDVGTWTLRRGTFTDLLHTLVAQPPVGSTQGAQAVQATEKALPGIGLRLVKLKRPGSPNERSVAAYIDRQALYLLQPAAGLIRFPRDTAASDFPAYMDHAFSPYLGGSVEVKLVLPVSRLRLLANVTAAQLATALTDGHVALGEKHGSPDAKRLLLDLLNLQRSPVTGIFLEQERNRGFQLDDGDLVGYFTGFGGLGVDSVQRLADQLAAAVRRARLPVYAIDPFKRFDPAKDHPFVIDGIRLERYRPPPTSISDTRARVTPEGMELRNRNMARAFCSLARPAGAVVICGADHIRPDGSGRPVHHEMLQYLCGISEAVDCVPPAT